MAGVIRAHDVRTRAGLAVLFHQVGKRLIDKSLKLAAFLVRERADGLKDIAYPPALRIFHGT